MTEDTHHSMSNITENIEGRNIRMGEQLDESQKEDLRRTLLLFPEVLKNEPDKTTLIEHHIPIVSIQPVRQRPYRIPHAYRAEVMQELKRMEEAGIIEESDSAWASPIVVVKKKDKKLRICVDYRKQNQFTETDAYPMPRIEELLDSVGQSKYITTIDLAKGYWQVPVAREDQAKTAFISPRGLFHFTTMPFGLRQPSNDSWIES